MSPIWMDGPRVRIDTLRRGDRFVSIDGEEWTYIRIDGALSGVHHVGNDAGERASFAGCAEGVRIDSVRQLIAKPRYARLGEHGFKCAGCGVVVNPAVGCVAHPHADVTVSP